MLAILVGNSLRLLRVAAGAAPARGVHFGGGSWAM
jgi:hypothetical protein